MNCESTYDESETENSLSKNILQIENEYETPTESNYYQTNQKLINFEKSDNTQNITDYAEQELKESSSMNNITKIQHVNNNHLRKKLGQIPLLLEKSKMLEKSKSKDFQSPDLEKEFLIDTGAEKNIVIILT